MEKNLTLLFMVVIMRDATGRMMERNGQNGYSERDKLEAGGKSYFWKTGNWGICLSGKGPNSCGQGMRERPVWCVDSDEKTVPDFLCRVKRKPERIRNCFTACRRHKDKLKWEVGQWGPCTEADDRMDLINDRAANGKLQEDDSAEHYGLMQRNVSCVLVSHDETKTRLTVDEENCFTIARKPDPVRLCNIPIPQDCVVTDFMEWSQCQDCHFNANQSRIRNVLVAPKNGGKPCPELSETRPCSLELECLKTPSSSDKKEFLRKISAWSECKTPGSVTSAEETGTSFDGNLVFQMMDVSTSAESSEKQTIFQAKVGYQTRDVVCKDSKGAIVDPGSCDEKAHSPPLRLRTCIASRDCVVSEWSAWTKTVEGCVEGAVVVRAEIHERKRQVVRLPEGNGQPCPHLSEKKETSLKEVLPTCSHKYRRVPSKWSECSISTGGELMKVVCGGGIQLRTVSCVSVSSGQPVEDVYCSKSESSENLPTIQRCEVACPRDCVVGEWGKWSSCLKDSCFHNVTSTNPGYRQRKRKILVEPSVNGLPCPAVKEVQFCGETHCYRWSIGHWETCILSSPGKCGPGVRKRSVKCVDVFKSTMDEQMCDFEQKPPDKESCLLPCPFDCVLSPWSEWSPCSHSCSGQKTLALRQRNRTVIAPSGPGGIECPNPDELTEMEPCNTHSCLGYSWLVLPWQPCKTDEIYQRQLAYVARFLQPRSRNGTRHGTGISSDEDSDSDKKSCGTGLRRREVWCMENNKFRVADDKCYPMKKPALSEKCVQDCPVNCELSPWTEWSTCPQECVPDASNEVRDGEVAPTQTRSRVILKSPMNGGASCQHLDEFRPCPLSGARCKHYKWQLSNWSECQLPTNLKCGEGFRTRGVWCSKNQRTTRVSPTFCLENDGPPPALSEKCSVDCLRHCVLSQWSPWSKCSSTCTGESVRTRQLIGHSSSRAFCLNQEHYPLRESSTCPCEFYAPSSDDLWSTCILEQPLEKVLANGRPAHGLCGSGTRYKRNICLNADGEIVEASFCGMKDNLLEEPCMVPCPVDCIQSEWSTWGECSLLCGPGVQNRTREIIQAPREGGRPCGADIEVKVCNTPCSNYRWISSGYTQCSLKNQDDFHGCGTGEQYRTVRCLDHSGTGIAVQVRDEYCDPVDRPEEISSCHIQCPGDCVVSPWSAWSECDEQCSQSKQRQRTRVMLRSPSGTPKSKECPSLIQVQKCQINVTCFTFEWKASPFGSCLPLGGSPCGEGVKTRAIYCRRSDGRVVDNDFCDSRRKPAPSEKWCHVECPVDCELSPWSQWNSSECVCGKSTGFEHRSRRIVTSPSSSGRPCPAVLEQRRQCRAEPCYTWKRGSWSPCILEGAACGHGTSYRNISCFRGNLEVDDEECFAHTKLGLSSKLSNVELIKLDLNVQTNCYMPCHGDCEVSEWSAWSHCHRNCRNNPSGGYQTRSRAVLKRPTSDGEACPATLWETRPCNSGVCLTFAWIMKGGNVVCRRSDGLFVFGGCDDKKKPCLKNCSLIKNSYCVAGSCVCLDGYLPRYRETTSELISCVASKDGVSVREKFAHPNVMADNEDSLRSHLLYLPNDDFNIWMFAMIGIGCLFVVFVAVSFYLMCHNSNSSSQENGTQVLATSKP